MNILIDARPLSIARPSGVTKVMMELLPHALDQLRDHRVILGTTGWEKPDLTKFLTPHVEHRHITAPNKLLSGLTASTLFSFDRFFKTTRPDLLLLFNHGHIGTPHIPYVLMVHDLALFIEPSWFSLRSQAWRYAVHAETLTKKAQHLFAISAWTKRSLIERWHIPESRITVLPFGEPNMVAGEPLPNQLQKKRFLLILGGNDKRKNAACVIAAFRELTSDPRFEDICLVIVGKPNLTLPDRTVVLDRPSDGLLRTLFEQCLLFLYPSWYEGFGLPLHEAALFQKPCIASTASALPETAPKGTLFASPSKPQLWLQCMKIILNNPLSHQTRSHLCPETWKESAERLVKISIGL